MYMYKMCVAGEGSIVTHTHMSTIDSLIYLIAMVNEERHANFLSYGFIMSWKANGTFSRINIHLSSHSWPTRVFQLKTTKEVGV